MPDLLAQINQSIPDRCVMVTNGPHAKTGNIMNIEISRPRHRQGLMHHPKYYEHREELLTFLEDYEHGDPDPNHKQKKDKAAA